MNKKAPNSHTKKGKLLPYLAKYVLIDPSKPHRIGALHG
jgi:hypothetical protein